MIHFPNAKINLGLYVTGKLPGGYHAIETCFYPVLWPDVLEMVTAENTSFHITGAAPDNTAPNTCTKAYELLKKDFPQLPPVEIHLHKSIPAGAGLGGGSADGAFALKLLNEKYKLGLNNASLEKYALQIGSDCPFFIRNTPALAQGRGEILESIALDVSHYRILLVNPKVHISTAWAFAQIQPEAKHGDLKKLIAQPVESWKESLHNVFEKPVHQHFPEIENIKNILYEKGAVYASLSGTGATTYGLFKKSSTPQFYFPDHYILKWC